VFCKQPVIGRKSHEKAVGYCDGIRGESVGMALVHGPATVRVMVVGKDSVVSRALAQLLGLDDQVEVLGEAPSIATAPIAELHPDIVILDEAGQTVDAEQTQAYLDQVAPDAKLCVLQQLHDCTVAELLQAVKLLAPAHNPAPRSYGAPVKPMNPQLAALSDREIQVVRLVAEGLSNKEISSRLSLSDKTVKNHISHILAKMNLTARTQVAVTALRAGLV
jgi:DNA-binding NarL/FixJ family response regulator